MNFIKRYFKRRRERKEKKQKMQTYLQMFRMFDAMKECEDSYLIFIDIFHHRVLISDALVAPLAQDDARWQAFFRNVGLWLQYRVGFDRWNELSTAARMKAVREEKEKYGRLTDQEQHLLNAKADMQLAEQLINEDAPELKDEYEFCVCKGILRSGIETEAIGVFKDGKVTLKTKF